MDTSSAEVTARKDSSREAVTRLAEVQSRFRRIICSQGQHGR